MNVLRLLPAAGFRRMPWKNGGGETVEIAVFPPDAGLDGFDWRVSMATVAVDGPFSSFPGIDRTLTVLTGAGIALAIDGAEPVPLVPDSPPLAFPADVPVDARLLGGPIIDLNVMTRRGRFDHRVTRHRVAAATDIEIAGDLALLLSQEAGLQAAGSGGTVALAAGDALMVEGGAALTLRGPAAGTPVTCYLVELWRRS